jgi:hypothetical protein
MTSSRSAILALLLIFIMRNLYRKLDGKVVRTFTPYSPKEESHAIFLEMSKNKHAVLIETLPIKHKFWIRTSSFNESYRPIKQIKL